MLEKYNTNFKFKNVRHSTYKKVSNPIEIELKNKNYRYCCRYWKQQCRYRRKI